MTRSCLLMRDFVQDRRVSMDLYADELLQGMRASVPGWSVDTFVPRMKDGPAGSAPGLGRMRWARYVGYPSQVAGLQADLFHVVDQGYGHLLWRLDPRRTVVTVHDLIPLLRWQGRIPGVARGRFPLLNALSVRQLRRAAALIAPSDSTARDLVTMLGCDRSRIHVVPNGISSVFQPASQPKAVLRSRLGLPPPPTRLLLASGQAFYKNLDTTLRVLRRLQDAQGDPVMLVKTGHANAAWESAVRSAGVEGRVITTGLVPASQIPTLYQACDCLLFPSHYEGFGFPVLEAMASGLPVVCSNAASLPEVAGDAAFTLDPLDVAGLADAVGRMLHDAATREALVARGLRHAARFTWEACAQGTALVYDLVAGYDGNPPQSS